MARAVEFVVFAALAVGGGCGGRTVDEPSQGGQPSSRGGASSAHGGATGLGGAPAFGGAEVEDHNRGGACEVSIELEPLPPVIEFVVDSSLSMSAPSSGIGETKWDVLKYDLANNLLYFPADRRIGLTCFPNIQLAPMSPVCFLPIETVPIAPHSLLQEERIVDALDSKLVFGATPTEDAYAYGLELIAKDEPLGSRYVVLITDGPPTYGRGCSGTGLTPVDTAPLVKDVATALDAGVQTFVIGLGEPAESAWMIDLAVAGGRDPECRRTIPQSCYYQDQENGATRDALGDISRRAQSCIFRPRDATQRLPVSSGSTVEYSDPISSVTFPAGNFEANCTVGADVSSTTNTVRLCRESCLHTTGAGTLRVRQPCK